MAREWDQENVVITGSTDGVVRCWSIEYVQKPIEKLESNEKVVSMDNDNNENSDNKPSPNENAMNASVEITKVDFIKQISITQEGGMH